MIFGSVCSGIESASVAWETLGWKAAWLAEIEKFPAAVLEHRHPQIPNLGDMTKLYENEVFAESEIDLLVGGTPCQSFSIAGLGGGLDDPRGQLALEFLRIAAIKRPRWLLWENVPGVLSRDGGRNFGVFVRQVQKLRYGFAYRVLDAQHFGVPQRRRRVFLVGHLGDWRRAVAVLFEQGCLSGNSAPRRKTRQEITAPVGRSTQNRRTASGKDVFGTLAANAETKLWLGNQEAFTGDYFVLEPIVIKGAAIGRKPEAGPQFGETISDGTSYTLNATEVHAVFDPNQITSKTNRSTPKAELSHTLPATENSPICFHWNARADEQRFEEELSGPLTVGQQPAFQNHSGIRRLTPLECERLQGFPDNYTQIPWKNKPPELCPDGPRYKAIGNSMAVPVMRWLGKRIHLVDGL